MFWIIIDYELIGYGVKKIVFIVIDIFDFKIVVFDKFLYCWSILWRQIVWFFVYIYVDIIYKWVFFLLDDNILIEINFNQYI